MTIIQQRILNFNSWFQTQWKVVHQWQWNPLRTTTWINVSSWGRWWIINNPRQCFVGRQSQFYSFRILIEKLWYSTDCCEFTLSKSFFTWILKMDEFERSSRCLLLPTLHRNDKNQLKTTSLNWKPVYQHRRT